MAYDLPPTPGDVFTFLASKWTIIAAFVGHLIRTETSRAVLKRDVETLREKVREDRMAAQSQRHEDMARIDARLADISRDIKDMLSQMANR